MESRRARKAARPAIHAMREGEKAFKIGRVVQMTKFWTVRQEELIREYGHLGAEAVAQAIEAECGVKRTVRAVQQHAHVIHASLRVKPVCPECGVIGLPLNYQSGLCPRCNTMMRLQEELAYNEILLRERIEAVGSDLFAEAVRLYNSKRQENARLCKKFGLPTRRQRKKGVDCCLCPLCSFWPDCMGPICDTG